MVLQLRPLGGGLEELKPLKMTKKRLSENILFLENIHLLKYNEVSLAEIPIQFTLPLVFLKIEHILLITMLTIKILFTINSLKKKLFRQNTIYNSFR